jgi:hypothetical protein
VHRDAEWIAEPDAEEYEAARRDVADACAPAPRDSLLKALVHLRGLTRNPNTSQDDLDLQVAAYLDELERWPADVALHVLATHRSDWFPSWAALEERLFEYGQRRLALAQALNV